MGASSGCVAKILPQSAKAASKCSKESKGSKKRASGGPEIDSRSIQSLGTFRCSQAREMATSNFLRSTAFPNLNSWWTRSRIFGGSAAGLADFSAFADEIEAQARVR